MLRRTPKASIRLLVSVVVLSSSFNALILPSSAAPKAKAPAKQQANPRVVNSQMNSSPNWMGVRRTKAAPADDTLIVCLYPGADKEQVADVLQEAHGTVTQTIHIDQDNYDILFVKPESGKSEQTLKTITKKRGKNFRSIDRNYTYNALDFPAPPNDPFFNLQWNLGDVHWTQAQAKFLNSQVRRATITILDTGSFTFSPNHELVNIRQWDASAGPGSPIVREKPHDVAGHGTFVSSIGGTLTDNEKVIAGVASFKPTAPVDITMLRITTTSNPNTALNTTMVNAIAWTVNHQRERGGPGAINISFGGGIPPLWANSAVQMLAHSLNRQGSHLFLGSGNDGQNLSAFPEGNVTVVQATDKNDELASFSNTVRTQAAAPGVQIPVIFGSQPLILALVGGTSASTPMWAASAALLQSINPRVNAFQAARILLATGKRTKQHKIIPQLDRAIRAIKHRGGDDRDRDRNDRDRNHRGNNDRDRDHRGNNDRSGGNNGNSGQGTSGGQVQSITPVSGVSGGQVQSITPLQQLK